MGRRGSDKDFEAVIGSIALMPWWINVLLAVVSWFLLSRVADAPIVSATQPGRTAVSVLPAVWKGLATGGQYILPLVFLIGAAVSAIRRHQSRKLLDTTLASPAADLLDGMRWQDFERLVGEAFRRQGYRVLETGGGGADGRVDLVLSRPALNGSEKVLVQCKHWRALKVGVDVVRELYGVMAARGAAAGIVVSSGRFTEEARQFASGRHVRLLDGPALHQMLRMAKSPPPDGGANDGSQAEPASSPQRPANAISTPSCPVCGQTMVERTAKRGANAGSRFWGCTTYPACRGTRRIECVTAGLDIPHSNLAPTGRRP